MLRSRKPSSLMIFHRRESEKQQERYICKWRSLSQNSSSRSKTRKKKIRISSLTDLIGIRLSLSFSGGFLLSLARFAQREGRLIPLHSGEVPYYWPETPFRPLRPQARAILPSKLTLHLHPLNCRTLNNKNYHRATTSASFIFCTEQKIQSLTFDYYC